MPSTISGPDCYGLSHDPDCSHCARCSVASACQTDHLKLDSRSLSEHLALLLAQGSASPDASLTELYDKLYQLHFGKRSYRKDSPRNRTLFAKLRDFLDEEGLDAEVFMTANMMRMKEWASRARYGFQPNMLLGDKAVGRYNAYVRATNRRLRRATADAVNYKTDLGKLRGSLFRAEKSVATLFVSSFMVGEPVTWNRAAKKAEVCDEWVLLQLGPRLGGHRYTELERKYGVAAVRREKSIAEFGAAVALADAHQAGLSSRIGCRDGDFTWPAFAALLARLFPVRERLLVPAAHWGGAF